MRILIVLIALTLIACGPSPEEIDNIATITCNVMGESRNMDSSMRIKEINAAREKIGAAPYLGTDDGIKESFEWGLCEALVKSDEEYRERKAEAQAVLAEELWIEQERIAEEKRVAALREEERKQRVSGALEDWRAAILERINTVPNPVKDVTFRVKYSDIYPVKLKFSCLGFHHMDTEFTVTFSNELETLRQGDIGACGGVFGDVRDTSLQFPNEDRSNLYKVIGSREEGSLMESVKSIDVEIDGINSFLAEKDLTPQESRSAAYKYVYPRNFHEELENRDLYSNPIKLRIYEK